MEQPILRATYPQRGGWAELQIGKTIIDFRDGTVYNPDGSKTYISRNIPEYAHSLAIRTRASIKIAFDVESNGLFDIPAGCWQHVDEEQFYRLVLISSTNTQIRLHASTGKKAFFLEAENAEQLLHAPTETINTTIPAELVPAVHTILDLTGKEPIQAFSFQITGGALGVYVGYDKDATNTDPHIGVLQNVNRVGFEILNKITVIAAGPHAAPIVIEGEAWRY